MHVFFPLASHTFYSTHINTRVRKMVGMKECSKGDEDCSQTTLFKFLEVRIHLIHTYIHIVINIHTRYFVHNNHIRLSEYIGYDLAHSPFEQLVRL